MWLSGARSPLAPTLPCSGTSGTIPALSIATSASTSSGRTPLVGRSSTLARSSMTARTTPGASGAPTPAAWLRIRLTWSASSRSGAMRTFASLPNPVLMP